MTRPIGGARNPAFPRPGRSALLLAGILLSLLPMREGARAAGPAVSAAARPAESPATPLTIGGRVKHELRLTVDDLRALPARRVDVSFESEHGITKASFTGVALWALLEKAGGIADPAKRGVLRHTITVIGRDGYRIVLSTGEIAPAFGAEAALLAYERDGKPLGTRGVRLVMPGDKRGGRDVRDVVAIDVE